MPFKYVGEEAIYHGRPLFKLLGQLKNFGVGRIVYRTSEYRDYPNQIHFYRILMAQPLMSQGDGGLSSEIDMRNKYRVTDAGSGGKVSFFEGNVVAERVFKSLRMNKPYSLSEAAPLPDFRLVPRAEEFSFCRLSQVRDYDVKRDAEKRPMYLKMSPLMQLLVERDSGNPAVVIGKRAAKQKESAFLLPVHKTYEPTAEGDPDAPYVVVNNFIDSHNLSKHLEEQYQLSTKARLLLQKGKEGRAESAKSVLPPLSWCYERISAHVGVRKHTGYVEGGGWEKTRERMEEEERALEQEALSHS